MDVGQVERVEAELDTFIERRAREARDANAIEKAWAASERAHREKIRREHRAAWYEFEMLLADNHAALSEEHRARAEALLQEPAEVADA